MTTGSTCDERALVAALLLRSRASDSRGLYLKRAAKPGHCHRWHLDYSYEGRRQTISLGCYPEISLEDARNRAQACRNQLALGIHPSQPRRTRVNSAPQVCPRGSFEEVGRRWFEIASSDWVPSYSSKVIRRLELHVFPKIGSVQLDRLRAIDVLALCRAVQNQGALETGQRVRELCSRIFCFAVAEGIISSDPCRDLRRALRNPDERHFAAVTDPSALADLLRKIDRYEGSEIVRHALQLTPLLMVRPGELRMARWGEFDLDSGVWLIPSVRMKRTKRSKQNGRPHIVFLARQAVELLESLFASTGAGEFVFAGATKRGGCISNSTLNAALRRMGYCTKTEVTGHGFRATARTLLVELLDWPEEVTEVQLAHTPKDPNKGAYNRAQFLEKRRLMMQQWADFLDELRAGRPPSKTHPVLTDFRPVTLRRTGSSDASPAFLSVKNKFGI